MTDTPQIKLGSTVEIVRYVPAAGDVPSTERYISRRIGRRGTVVRWRNAAHMVSSVPSRWLDVRMGNGGLMALQIDEVVAVDD